MKKIIASSVGVLVLGGLIVGLLNHPVRVLANPFSPADTRITPELRAAVEERHPGANIIDIELDLDGFDLYLSNGFMMEVGFFGAIDPVSQSWSNDDDDDSYENEYDQNERNERYITPAELPQTILDYITTNYPQASIVVAELDDDGYEVYLSDAVELEFRLDGSFVRVEQDRDEMYVDASTLPETIQSYLTTNYPNASIRYVEMDTREYNVYLDNGLELYFSLDGTLLEIERDDD